MTETPEQARAYARLEQSLEPERQRSIARGPIGLLAVLIVLSLAVGITAAVDLNRLQTPRGAALGWSSAVLFGDCEAYRRLSVAPPEAAAPRPEEEVCADLRRETEPARESPTEYDVELLSVEQDGDEATGTVRLTRPDGPLEVELPLRRAGDGWVVVRTFELCLEVGCP